MPKIIKVPPFQEPQNLSEFFHDLSSSTGDVTLDFGEVGFATPKGMVGISSAICAAIKKNETIILSITNHEHLGYTTNVGFFNSFGFNFETKAN